LKTKGKGAYAYEGLKFACKNKDVLSNTFTDITVTTGLTVGLKNELCYHMPNRRMAAEREEDT